MGELRSGDGGGSGVVVGQSRVLRCRRRKETDERAKRARGRNGCIYGASPIAESWGRRWKATIAINE